MQGSTPPSHSPPSLGTTQQTAPHPENQTPPPQKAVPLTVRSDEETHWVKLVIQLHEMGSGVARPGRHLGLLAPKPTHHILPFPGGMASVPSGNLLAASVRLPSLQVKGRGAANSKVGARLVVQESEEGWGGGGHGKGSPRPIHRAVTPCRTEGGGCPRGMQPRIARASSFSRKTRNLDLSLRSPCRLNN